MLPGPTDTVGLQNYFKGLAEETNQPMDDVVKNYFKTYEPTRSDTYVCDHSGSSCVRAAQYALRSS